MSRKIYIKDKHSDMSEELSDTDSVNSEIVNSVYCVNSSTSNTDKNCQDESQFRHTNHMHDSRTSLINTSHDTSQDNIANDIISTHYVNMVMDDMTNNKDTEIIELISQNQESHTPGTSDSELNFNELAHTEKIENFVIVNKQHF